MNDVPTDPQPALGDPPDRANTDPLPSVGQRRVTGFATLSAHEMKAGLAAGDFTARQLVDGLVAHIEAHDPQLHTLVHLDIERAQAAADASDARRARGAPLGPLAGLPMTVKESIDVAGMPSTLALPWLRNHRATDDAAAVRRLKAAGAIIMGKTALPFASYDFQTAPPGRPATCNPHDQTRTPGGSSGGAAAALAAGFTPLEIGSDVAGSIRLPAAFCGVVGLRPSEGALPQQGHANLPDAPPSMRHLVTIGPMARTAEDCRLLFEVLRRPAPFQGPARPLHPAGEVELDRLHFGWCDALGDVPLPSIVRETFADFRSRLSATGARVEPYPPGETIDMPAAFDLWGRIQGTELRWGLPLPLRAPPLGWLLPLVMRLRFGKGRFARGINRGLRAGPAAYLDALAARDVAAERFDRWVGGVDAWLLPAGPPAFEHQPTGRPIDVDGAAVPYADLPGMYHCPLALYGVPVLSLPISRRGLPIGVQIVVPRWHDNRLLAIGEAIERALGPGYRCPAPIFGVGAGTLDRVGNHRVGER